MPSSAPLQVYLDSADYSTLSTPARLTAEPQKAEALKYIQDLINKDAIEVRFSGTIFGEIVHINAESKQSAIQRADLLSYLCRGKAVIHCFNLFELEIRSFALSGKPIQREAIQRNNSDCIGLEFNLQDATKFRQDAINNIRDIIQQNVTSRNQRRNLESKLIKGNYLRPSAISFLNALPQPSSSDELSALIEILSNKEEFFQFLTGAQSAQNFYADFIQKLMNPLILTEHILDAKPELQEKLHEAVRANSQKLALSLQNTLNKVCPLKADLSASEFKKLLIKAVDQAMNGFRKTFITKWAGDAFDTAMLDMPWGTYPSFDLYILLAKEFLLLRSVDEKEITPNDMLDLLHASYAPYFDIIRLDGRTAELYKRIPEELRCKYAVPVSKIENIKQTYETALVKERPSIYS